MQSISLVLIVKNEERCIDRCLASFHGLVDEIIVVDTGSTDDTVRKAEQHNVRLMHYRWQNDFAAARNFALDAAQGDWNLVVDADEWLLEGAAEILRLRDQPTEFVGLIEQVNQLQDQGFEHYSSSYIPRVLPKSVRYQGRIHEQPRYSLQSKNLPIRFAHDGYLVSNRTQKIGRNETILRSELADFPQDAYLNYQLGKELSTQDAFNEAIVFFEIAKSHCLMDAPWRHDLIVRLLFSYKKNQQFAQGLATIESEERNYLHSPDFYFVCGDFLIDCALHSPQHAAQLMPMIEMNFLKAREIGENPAIDERVIGRGSFLAAYNLYAFHTSMGHTDQAEHFYQLYEAEKKALGDRFL